MPGEAPAARPQAHGQILVRLAVQSLLRREPLPTANANSLSFRRPTGLADGLALKEQRYGFRLAPAAHSVGRFAPRADCLPLERFPRFRDLGSRQPGTGTRLAYLKGGSIAMAPDPWRPLPDAWAIPSRRHETVVTRSVAADRRERRCHVHPPLSCERRRSLPPSARAGWGRPGQPSGVEIEPRAAIIRRRRGPCAAIRFSAFFSAARLSCEDLRRQTLRPPAGLGAGRRARQDARTSSHPDRRHAARQA